MKIFITMPKNELFDTFLTPAVMKRLNELGEVSQNPYDHNLKIEEVIELASDADILITCWGSCKYSKKDVEKMPNLKLIAHAAGTVAYMVDPDLFETNVKLVNGNDVFARSVAEGTLCYTLAALRKLEYHMGVVRAGGFQEDFSTARGLFYKKVGIVGFGAVAQHYVNMIRCFKPEILIHSSHLTDEEAAKYGARTASLDEIFSECDIISIHLSKTPKTIGMITRELLEKIKPGALFVNTARGRVVDEDALFEFLLAGRFNAALDVFAKEPIDKDSPIRQCKNALLTPHIAGPTIDMRAIILLELCEDFLRLEKGEPLLNEVTASMAARMSLD